MNDSIELRAYKNTTSSAGMPQYHTIKKSDIHKVFCWFNVHCNPSYVFHMVNGDTYYSVDNYGAMNGLDHLTRKLVDRKKDMFNKYL